MTSRARRRRWDAGAVVMTTRDERVLTTIGDHLWVRQVDLRELLGGVSDSAVRGWLDRMTRAGLVRRERRVGAGWVALTRAGMGTVDLDYEHRPLSTWVADHATTTLRLRLQLLAAYPGSEWRSERWWRRRQAQSGGHMRVPDGSLLLPSGTHVAVEVETARKAPKRLERIAREYATDVDVAWWFTTPELFDWLHRTWREAARPARPAIEVKVLPEGVRP
jgi:DNA-binding transcriptional ArsR family regulator